MFRFMSKMAVMTTVMMVALLASTFGQAMAAPAGDYDKVFSVSVRFTSETFIDLAPQGESIGDLYASSDPVYDKHGNKVGYDSWTCVLTNVEKKLGQCTFSVIFEDGQLTMSGASNDDPEAVYPVTGGTGKYKGATGEMVYKEVAEDCAIYTFYLK